MEMVNVQSVVPNIRVELKYATQDNFTGHSVYSFQECFLLRCVSLKLLEVQQELEKRGLGLTIWDGFRPLSVQWIFWNLIPDERYVSDPKQGGRHTRGTAVDVTLVTLEGEELVMPSLFDDFSERAHRNYSGASCEAMVHRALLEEVMQKHSFIGLLLS